MFPYLEIAEFFILPHLSWRQFTPGQTTQAKFQENRHFKRKIEVTESKDKNGNHFKK